MKNVLLLTAAIAPGWGSSVRSRSSFRLHLANKQCPSRGQSSHGREYHIHEHSQLGHQREHAVHSPTGFGKQFRDSER